MSENRFTDGNIIILYAVYQTNSSSIPDYILERIKTCLQIYKIVTLSKPDGDRTTLFIVANSNHADLIKNELINLGINEQIIKINSKAKSVSKALRDIIDFIKSSPNPPFIYFIGSVWQKDVFDSIILSKYKGYKIKFEGALDHRPVSEVELDKAADTPKKGKEYYKQKLKNKGIDMLLNYILPDDKK